MAMPRFSPLLANGDATLFTTLLADSDAALLADSDAAQLGVLLMNLINHIRMPPFVAHFGFVRPPASIERISGKLGLFASG